MKWSVSIIIGPYQKHTDFAFRPSQLDQDISNWTNGFGSVPLKNSDFRDSIFLLYNVSYVSYKNVLNKNRITVNDFELIWSGRILSKAVLLKFIMCTQRHGLTDARIMKSTPTQTKAMSYMYIMEGKVYTYHALFSSSYQVVFEKACHMCTLVKLDLYAHNRLSVFRTYFLDWCAYYLSFTYNFPNGVGLHY